MVIMPLPPSTAGAMSAFSFAFSLALSLIKIYQSTGKEFMHLPNGVPPPMVENPTILHGKINRRDQVPWGGTPSHFLARH